MATPQWLGWRWGFVQLRWEGRVQCRPRQPHLALLLRHLVWLHRVLGSLRQAWRSLSGLGFVLRQSPLMKGRVQQGA